jgi:hypothetical protein
MADLAAAEQELEEREMALQEVKEQYDAAVSEKQRLTDAANSCLRKMTAATTLINGLGGEKIRWTQMSQQFKEQLGRSVLFRFWRTYENMGFQFNSILFLSIDPIQEDVETVIRAKGKWKM